MNLDEPKISKNPIANRPKYRRDKERKPPKIATVEQVERILQVARDTDDELGMLAFWVITLFLGCRPNSEMSLMTWDDVYLNDPDDSFPMVSEEGNRTTRVTIYPFVYEWLMICNRSKPIFPRTPDMRRIEELFYTVQEYCRRNGLLKKRRNGRTSNGILVLLVCGSLKTLNFRLSSNNLGMA